MEDFNGNEIHPTERERESLIEDRRAAIELLTLFIGGSDKENNPHWRDNRRMYQDRIIELTAELSKLTELSEEEAKSSAPDIMTVLTEAIAFEYALLQTVVSLSRTLLKIAPDRVTIDEGMLSVDSFLQMIAAKVGNTVD